LAVSTSTSKKKKKKKKSGRKTDGETGNSKRALRVEMPKNNPGKHPTPHPIPGPASLLRQGAGSGALI
jgi:hypothetical protein